MTVFLLKFTAQRHQYINFFAEVTQHYGDEYVIKFSFDNILINTFNW